MTDKLQRLKELCEKATPGPWRLGHRDDTYTDQEKAWAQCQVYGPWHPVQEWAGIDRSHVIGTLVADLTERDDPDDSGITCEVKTDAQFIAAARSALPLLIEVAEAAKDMVRYDPEVTSFELEAALDALEREL